MYLVTQKKLSLTLYLNQKRKIEFVKGKETFRVFEKT